MLSRSGSARTSCRPKHEEAAASCTLLCSELYQLWAAPLPGPPDGGKSPAPVFLISVTVFGARAQASERSPTGDSPPLLLGPRAGGGPRPLNQCTPCSAERTVGCRLAVEALETALTSCSHFCLNPP